jgi:Bacterial PH domain
MVDVSISGGNLVLHVRGADKLWAFKSSLEIPLAHIREIRADSEIVHGWWHGIRMPGTNVPGVLTAGTFYQDGKRVFWDVHNPDNTVVIELKDERYNELVVEVADQEATVELVKSALPR